MKQYFQKKGGKWDIVNDMSSFNPYCGREKRFILYANEVKDGDDDHMPEDEDDLTFWPKFHDYFNLRAVVSTFGGLFFIVGILSLFVLLPII